jgi:hypothetical protein
MNSVEQSGNRHELICGRIEAPVLWQPSGPGRPGAPTPLVGRGSEQLLRCAAGEKGFEVVEAAVHTAKSGGRFGAMEGCFNYRLASGVEVPRTGEPHAGAVGQVDPRLGVVFDRLRAGLQQAAMRVEPRGDLLNRRKAEQPQREVDQVNAQVDDAAAARFRTAVEPRLVWTVGIMKGQVGRDRPSSPLRMGSAMVWTAAVWR